MSEFLKNFRNAQSNRYSGQRNSYDGHYYGHKEIRSGNDRRAKQNGEPGNKIDDPPPTPDFFVKFEEFFPTLEKLLETMINNQDELFELKKRQTDSMDIIAKAFNEIAITIGKLEQSKKQSPSTREQNSETEEIIKAKTETEAEAEETKDYSLEDIEKEGMQSAASKKREIIKMMKKLRKKGGTYKEIANFLNQKTIPTFSNSGKWHAQTIHRLCSKTA